MQCLNIPAPTTGTALLAATVGRGKRRRPGAPLRVTACCPDAIPCAPAGRCQADLKTRTGDLPPTTCQAALSRPALPAPHTLCSSRLWRQAGSGVGNMRHPGLGRSGIAGLWGPACAASQMAMRLRVGTVEGRHQPSRISSRTAAGVVDCLMAEREQLREVHRVARHACTRRKHRAVLCCAAPACTRAGCSR